MTYWEGMNGLGIPSVVLNSPKYTHPPHYVQRTHVTSAVVLSRGAVICWRWKIFTFKNKNGWVELEGEIMTNEGRGVWNYIVLQARTKEKRPNRG